MTYTHKVQYYETDRMSITHHSNYIRFMEEARIWFLDQLGCGYDRMEREGIISPVMSISCDYKKPTTFPDEIAITITVAELTRLKLKLTYTMRTGDTVVCTAESTHCFLSSAGKPVSIQRQFPEFHSKLYALLQDTGRNRQ